MARFEFVLDIMLEQPFPGYSLRCPKIHFQDEMHPDPDRDYFLRETLQEDLEPLLTRVVRLLANARGDWGMITPRDSYYQSVLVKLMAAVVTTSEDIKLTQELVATLEWDAHTQTKAVDLRFDVRRRPFRVHIQNEVYEALSMADHRRAKLEPLKETLRQHIVFWFPRLQRYFQPEPFWRIIDQNTRAVQRLLPKPEIFRMRSAFDESKTRLLSLFFSPHGIHVDRRLPATDYIVAFLVVVVTVTMFLVVSFFVRRMERPHIDSARLIPEPVFNRVTLLRSLQKQFQGDVTHYFRFDRAPRLMTRMYMRFRILGCGVTVCYLVYLARYLETMFFLFLVASTIAYRTIWATAMTPDAKQLILPVFLRKVNPMDDPPPGDDTLGEFREQIRDTQMVHVEHYRFWLAVYSTLAGLLGVVPLVYRATYKTYLEFYQSGEALDFVTTFWMVNLLFELVYRVELVLHFYDTLKICMFACMNSDCEEKSLRLFLMEFPFLEPYLAGVGPMDHADASVGHFLRLM
ncbi:MAG: hypothetical protein KVP17_004611 [Porospora cf. gigantea B]|nr:MAG: hypothetical protein KVP17_004611 [Porospora cf. gigantea B]